MQEEFTQKWAIISLLDDFPEGGEFYYTDFPLHVTLAGVFASELNGSQLGHALMDFLENERPVEVEVDRQEMFGPNKDIGVMLIKQNAELMGFYKRFFQCLDVWVLSITSRSIRARAGCRIARSKRLVVA
jgi:2'-5' RNA ligase